MGGDSHSWLPVPVAYVRPGAAKVVRRNSMPPPLTPLLPRSPGFRLRAAAGSDAVAALLSLALAPAPAPRCLRSAAYQALLAQPSLLGALSAAELVSEEELEQSEVESSDAIAQLEQVEAQREGKSKKETTFLGGEGIYAGWGLPMSSRCVAIANYFLAGPSWQGRPGFGAWV